MCKYLIVSQKYLLPYFYFLFEIEPKNIDETLLNECWILTMQEDINQFEENDI